MFQFVFSCFLFLNISNLAYDILFERKTESCKKCILRGFEKKREENRKRDGKS